MTTLSRLFLMTGEEPAVPGTFVVDTVENAKKEPEQSRLKRRYVWTQSPVSSLGIRASNKDKPQWLVWNPFCFDMYEEVKESGKKIRALSYGQLARLVHYEVFSRNWGTYGKMLERFDSSVSEQANSGIVRSDFGYTGAPSGANGDYAKKWMKKLTSGYNYVWRPSNQMSTEYDQFFERWAAIQFANPLKWAEFFISLLHRTTHYGLSRLGFALQEIVKNAQEHSLGTRVLAGVAMTVVAVVRLVLQVGLGLASFIAHAIASPIKSFHDNNDCHPVLGALSALVTAVAVGVTLYFTAAFWLPVVGIAAAKIGLACVATKLVAPLLLGTITFLGVVTSGIVRDAYVWGKNVAKSPLRKDEKYYGEKVLGVELPSSSHAALRADRYKRLEGSTENDEELKKKVICSKLSLLVALPILPFVAVAGIVMGTVERGSSKASQCMKGLFSNSTGTTSRAIVDAAPVPVA